MSDAALLYERVKRVIPPWEWPVFASDVEAILAPKRARHRHPGAQLSESEIFHCVAAAADDSLAHAREAAKAGASGIVVTGVYTSAAVKAEADIYYTSGNAKKVVESLSVSEAIMLPKIRGAFKTMRHEVTIDAEVASRACRVVECVLAI